MSRDDLENATTEYDLVDPTYEYEGDDWDEDDELEDDTDYPDEDDEDPDEFL